MSNETYDFGDGRGPVPAHRHTNPDGSVGGLVSRNSTVSRNSFVSIGSTVIGSTVIDSTVRDSKVRDSTVIGPTGHDGYGWWFGERNGVHVMGYGCECHPVDSWPHDEAAKKYCPDQWETWAARTRAVIADNLPKVVTP